MAFVLNHVDAKHGLYTVSLHEPDAAHNRVVHVIVPVPTRGRTASNKLQTPAQMKTLATAAAKKALQDAAASL
jgi:hypothetical protein